MRSKHSTINTPSRKPLTIKETSLSASIAEYLTVHKIYNDRLNAGKIQTQNKSWIYLCKKGTPDRFFILNGQIVFIEVKKQGKKATPEQLAKHEELRQSGAIVLVVDSFDSFVNQFNEVREKIKSKSSIEVNNEN